MDLALFEEGNGGELIKQGNDLTLIGGWQNMVYLGLFGGNVGAITKKRLPNEQDGSWWGNNLFYPNLPYLQFNSYTEAALKDNSLSSAGRINIQQAVIKDLEFMRDFANISVEVSIIGLNHVKITIFVKQPNNLDGKVPDQYRSFVFIWDSTKQLLMGDFDPNDFNDDFFV